MATRFYLPSIPASTGVDISPSFGAWTATTEMVRRTMSPVKVGSAMANFSAWANSTPAANATRGSVQFISEPLAAGIGFVTTDTVKCYVLCQESATNDNINRQPLIVKIIAADGTTVQATLLALGAYGPNTTEWVASPTAATNKTVADGDALTSNYTTVYGDRLVIEIGQQVSSAGGTTVTGVQVFGDSSASDLGENETDTTQNNPWFEISRTCVFVPQAQRMQGEAQSVTASAGVATMNY